MRASPTPTTSISTGPNVWCSAPRIAANKGCRSSTTKR
jgi:hypothetical protein